MYDQSTLAALNARKYATTIKAATKDSAPAEYEIHVNLGYLYVGDEKTQDRDSAVLYISANYTEGNPDPEEDYYINHTAGIQRWHKHGASRVEALGYAKQAGVTEEQFKEAFPWKDSGNPDPLSDLSNVDSQVECEGCEKSFDVDVTEFDDTYMASLCEECYCGSICDECGSRELDLLKGSSEDRICSYCVEEKKKEADSS